MFPILLRVRCKLGMCGHVTIPCAACVSTAVQTACQRCWSAPPTFIHSFIARFPIQRSGALQQTVYGSPPCCPVLGSTNMQHTISMTMDTPISRNYVIVPTGWGMPLVRTSGYIFRRRACMRRTFSCLHHFESIGQH